MNVCTSPNPTNPPIITITSSTSSTSLNTPTPASTLVDTPASVCITCEPDIDTSTLHKSPHTLVSRVATTQVTSSTRMLTNKKTDDAVEKPRHTPPIILAALLLIWFAASTGSTLTNKTLMTTFPYPVTLTIVHLFSSVIVDCVVITSRGLSLSPFRHDLFRVSLPVAFTISFAKVLTYVSYGYVPASLTHTAKASSPVFSVILTRILDARLPHVTTLLSLIPITVGVILSALTEINFVFLGFIAAILASAANVANSTYSKKALSHVSRPDPIIFHLYVSFAAVLLLFPYAAIHDARAIYTASAALLDADVSSSPRTLSSQYTSYVPFQMILFSLTMHYVQNISSIYFLRGVTVLTHQVAQLMKRLIVITSTVIWFQNQISILNGVGMALALLGFFAYGMSKHQLHHSTFVNEKAKLQAAMEGGDIPMTMIQHKTHVNTITPETNGTYHLVNVVEMTSQDHDTLRMSGTSPVPPSREVATSVPIHHSYLTPLAHHRSPPLSSPPRVHRIITSR